eukprot:GHRQ01011342.1.p2 GENE.GHRQ01011342.1~~GHRQ01011342.1.p2  ORF type:complete len:219 (+),score=65.24 GHRQ01011342.1:429-1085(+)
MRARLPAAALEGTRGRLQTSGSGLRQCSSCRRSLRVAATLVGPDPTRLAAAATDVLDRSSKCLRGREVEEAAMWRCIELQQAHPQGLHIPMQRWSKDLLEQAYSRCAEVTSEYAKTFYLGTQLMTPQQAKAIWAIYVWCRRTDELVDGPNASRITPKVRQSSISTVAAIVTCAALLSFSFLHSLLAVGAHHAVSMSCTEGAASFSGCTRTVPASKQPA